MSKGNVFVLSGASGVGKSTVLKRVMAARDDLRFSVSATTRPPREGEQDGVDYFFVTRQQFEEMIAQGLMLEYDEHHANYYGTPKNQMADGVQMVLDIEPNGAFQVKSRMPDATLIFITPPSMAELERRLRGRGDTPEDQIEIRLDRAHWEMEQGARYDHVVVNDDVERCAQEILKIIAQKADR